MSPCYVLNLKWIREVASSETLDESKGRHVSVRVFAALLLLCYYVSSTWDIQNLIRYYCITNSLFSSWRSALWTQLPGHRVPILRATVGPGDRRDAVRAEWHVSLCGGKVYGRPPYKTSQRTSRRRDYCLVVTSIMWFYNYTVFLNSWPRRSFIHVVVCWSISIYRLYLSVDLN